MVALGAHEPLQHRFQAAGVQSAGRPPRDKRPGLDEVVSRGFLDLSQSPVQHRVRPLPRRLQLGSRGLGEGDHGHEALGQGVVDLPRPALPLGGGARRVLGGGELPLGPGQGLHGPLLVGQRGHEIGPGHLDPGHPRPRDQAHQDCHQGGLPPILLALHEQGDGDADAEDDDGRRRGPVARMDQPQQREDQEEPEAGPHGAGQRHQVGGRERPGENAPGPPGQPQPAEGDVDAPGASVAPGDEVDEPVPAAGRRLRPP